MKKILTFLALILCVAFTSQAADTCSAAERSMRAKVLNYLHNEGYASASVDEDGDVEFKAEGRTYYIEFREFDDGVYVELYYLIGTEDEDTFTILNACETATRKYKFVKVYRLDGVPTVIFSAPTYVDSIATYKALFPTLLQVINSARNTFLDFFE